MPACVLIEDCNFLAMKDKHLNFSKSRNLTMNRAEADRISNLHTNITDIILSCLPLRDAVRTSILSKGWRYKWTTVPSLVFINNDCCPHLLEEQAPVSNDGWPIAGHNPGLVRAKLISVINHVLSLHTGSVQVFKVDQSFSPLDVGPWIARLSQSSVKELKLSLCNKENEFPCSLFTCDSLVHLNLGNCVLKPPPPVTFKGFMSLKTLSLCRVALTEDAFESLVSGCPLLENLTAIGLVRPKHIKINAPKLKKLRISGHLESITFGDTHHELSAIAIELYYCLSHANVEGDLTQFFINLPSIKTLMVKGDIWRYWCAGFIPERLPTACFALNTLTIGIDLTKMRESLALLCILRSSPNLTTLNINAGRSYLERYLGSRSKWLEENEFSCALDALQTVVLRSISGFREELDFVRFVLMSSAALEKIYILSGNKAYIDSIARSMASFRKASTRAEVVFENCS